jgi:chemotaxis protein methyltransferase CheR
MTCVVPQLSMTPQVFAILSGLVEERLGLWYALADKSLFESKVSVRALELGFDSMLDYYYFLRYDDVDGRELERLSETLVVNETFFFREFDQVQTVLSRFALPLIEAGIRPRIWSAACSTGEEPSTIAIWLAERGKLAAVQLLASDVSAAALAVAREGRYRPRSLRQIPDGVDPSRFIASESGALVVNPKIRAAIEWRKLNLLDAAAVAAVGEQDIILCRNLLIYFREDVVRRVVAGLTDRLKLGGVLVVGVSESLMRFGTRLRCEEQDGVFVYRKVLA